MIKIFSWALAITVIAASACDDDDTAGLQETDRNFITNASEANLAEIDLGRLAAMKSATPSVQDFGNMMVTEHQTALDELEGIANEKNVDMTTALNAAHQELKQKLSTMTGYAFDTAYMRSQVKDHEKTIALFETEITSGTDEQVKAYANKYLPHIEMHHHKADSILNSLDQ
jgi:putative membrane protein